MLNVLRTISFLQNINRPPLDSLVKRKRPDFIHAGRVSLAELYGRTHHHLFPYTSYLGRGDSSKNYEFGFQLKHQALYLLILTLSLIRLCRFSWILSDNLCVLEISSSIFRLTRIAFCSVSTEGSLRMKAFLHSDVLFHKECISCRFNSDPGYCRRLLTFTTAVPVMDNVTRRSWLLWDGCSDAQVTVLVLSWSVDFLSKNPCYEIRAWFCQAENLTEPKHWDTCCRIEVWWFCHMK